MDIICRTCLRTQDNLSPLFERKELLNRIADIASIQLNDIAGYPTNICEECITNINTLYNFRKIIQTSELELKARKAAEKRQEQRKKMQTKPATDEEDEKPLIYIKTELEQAGNNSNSSNPSSPCHETPENNDDDFYQSDDTEPQTDNNNKDDIQENVIETITILPPLKKCACNECGLEFTSRFKLYNHRRTVHVVPGVCNICGIVVRADNLRRHVQLHSEGPASCHHCGKIFKNSESLRGHLLIHRGHIFTCEKCGKTSKVRAEHRRHMKSHSDPEIGKMMCNICGKKVRDLRKHMHSHTGERPHVCTFCQKGFTSPYALKVHTRQHTNEKPYACNLCTAAYPQKVSLVSHLKSKHGIKYENTEST